MALSGFSNQEAVEILKTTGSVVRLTVVRYLRGLKFEELRAGICQANMATPTVTAEDKENYTGKVIEIDSRSCTLTYTV